MSEKEEKKVQEEIDTKPEEKVENVAENNGVEEMSEKDVNTIEEKNEKVEEKVAENVETSKKKEKKAINALKIFYKPAEAIKTAVKHNYWKSGLIFLLVYFLVVGVLSAFQVVQVRFASYDAQVDYLEEKLDQAEENYSKRGTTYYKVLVENYEERLDEVKSNKWSIFKDIELYLSMIKNFAVSLASTVIRILLLILFLFVIGKIFTKQGKFSQIIAGVGLSVNVYYINLIVLPLLAKFPLMGSVSALASVVSAFVLVLLYLVFKNTFEADEDKSAIGAFLSMALVILVTTFVADGFTFVSGIIEKIFA